MQVVGQVASVGSGIHHAEHLNEHKQDNAIGLCALTPPPTIVRFFWVRLETILFCNVNDVRFLFFMITNFKVDTIVKILKLQQFIRYKLKFIRIAVLYVKKKSFLSLFQLFLWHANHQKQVFL